MQKEESVTIDLLHRAVLAKHTDEGLRAASGGSPSPAYEIHIPMLTTNLASDARSGKRSAPGLNPPGSRGRLDISWPAIWSPRAG